MKNNQVILIDDDEDDLEIITVALKEAGCELPIVPFKRSTDAWTYLQTTRFSPAMIICDINMPNMNGMELRSRIFNDEQLRMKTVPFLFLSTSYQDAEVQKAYELFVQGYFQKSGSMDMLTKTMGAILDYWRVCRKPGEING